MVTKKRSGRKAAPRRRRTYAARRAAPRRRTNKSGVPMIPAAAATVALVAVNAGRVKALANSITNNGRNAPKTWIYRTIEGITGKGKWVNGNMKAFISGEALIADAAAVAGGYVAGEVVKKYAPGVIKRPLGKIAKKIPKVI